MIRLALALVLLLASAASAFNSVTTLAMATRNAGTYTFQGVTVPTGVVGLNATMDVSQATNPLPSLSLELEGSLDGGTTWMLAGSFTNPAGNKAIRPGGATTTTLGITVGGGPFWSDSQNVNRRLRGTAILGGSMRFALVVTPL